MGETDHVQAPLLVDADGDLVRPWVTWFVDTAITGTPVTPGVLSRASVLAALRAAVLREEPYGPAGGTPERVRVDRGKDFLSTAVTAAFGTMGVTVKDLPAYSPHLKGTVENLDRAVDRMLFAAPPGYTLTTAKPRSARRGKGPGHRPETSDAMSFHNFTAEALAWTHWWNTEHRPKTLSGRMPLEAWQADPTPVTDIPPPTCGRSPSRTMIARGSPRSHGRPAAPLPGRVRQGGRQLPRPRRQLPRPRGPLQRPGRRRRGAPGAPGRPEAHHPQEPGPHRGREAGH
ncbi:hypothetical protein [Streptomyces wedmorensis]